METHRYPTSMFPTMALAMGFCPKELKFELLILTFLIWGCFVMMPRKQGPQQHTAIGMQWIQTLF